MSPPSATFPLLGCDASAVATIVVAYRCGTPIYSNQYLRDVYSVSQNLPAAQYVLNVCGDRYNIAVLLAAVMLKNKTSLLPPNTAARTLQTLVESYGDVVMVGDDISVGAGKQIPAFANAISLESLITPTFAGSTPIPSFSGEQLVGILFTSGSTGEPTPNPRTWGALCAGVRAEAKALMLDGLCQEGTAAILGTVPAQHSYGLESTLALPLQNGYALSADQSFYPADIAVALTNMPRPRVLVTTPFHLKLLLDAESANLPKLDLVVSATAPLSPQLALKAEAVFAAPVREIYGCTEAGQIASRRTTEGEAWTLFPNVRLEKRGDTTWAADGHVGDARALGDVIEITSDHQFLLHGRAGDLINVAGKRTSLAHLNFHLNSIDGVDDGVFVMPSTTDDDLIVRLTAYVVTRTLTAEQILAALRSRIDAVFLPRPIRLVTELPRNQTGKLTQQALGELSSKGVASESK
jgi:acyl-coenzyme A synthetase/AMP-(fatty) acid ligase